MCILIRATSAICKIIEAFELPKLHCGFSFCLFLVASNFQLTRLHASLICPTDCNICWNKPSSFLNRACVSSCETHLIISQICVDLLTNMNHLQKFRDSKALWKWMTKHNNLTCDMHWIQSHQWAHHCSNSQLQDFWRICHCTIFTSDLREQCMQFLPLQANMWFVSVPSNVCAPGPLVSPVPHSLCDLHHSIAACAFDDSQSDTQKHQNAASFFCSCTPSSILVGLLLLTQIHDNCCCHFCFLWASMKERSEDDGFQRAKCLPTCKGSFHHWQQPSCGLSQTSSQHCGVYWCLLIDQLLQLWKFPLQCHRTPPEHFNACCSMGFFVPMDHNLWHASFGAKFQLLALSAPLSTSMQLFPSNWRS